jgi:DNA-binding transcriptional LysR family regulator
MLALISPLSLMRECTGIAEFRSSDIHTCMSAGPAEFDWDHAKVFLVTAQEGSLSAAARKLEQTQPTLSRQVAALERQLGVTLFERVGKRLVLTETGQHLLEHVRRMSDAAHLVTMQASGRSQGIVGQVRISAGEALSAYVLPPLIERIRRAHPEIAVHVVASNQLSDLLRREADIAIRHVRPEQSELVAKKVRDSSAHLYAATSWLELHGRPKSTADLERATFVGADDNARFVEVLQAQGLSVTLEQFKWTTDNHIVGWEMVRRGLGVGAMITEIAQRAPDVEAILPEVVAIPVPFWLCTHRELHTSRKIRVVFDLLADALTSLE